jgi:hypothetical protein
MNPSEEQAMQLAIAALRDANERIAGLEAQLEVAKGREIGIVRNARTVSPGANRPIDNSKLFTGAQVRKELAKAREKS